MEHKQNQYEQACFFIVKKHIFFLVQIVYLRLLLTPTIITRFNRDIILCGQSGNPGTPDQFPVGVRWYNEETMAACIRVIWMRLTTLTAAIHDGSALLNSFFAKTH